MSDSYEVSVILTTFNASGKDYLRQSIESVLNQTFENYELLIINDGSTDSTNLICRDFFNDERVRYYEKTNGGLSSARNYGIQRSKGKYICFLDDDDMWVREKLAEQLQFYKSHSDRKIGLVTTWMELIDENNQTIGFRKQEGEGDIYHSLFYNNIINGSSVMIKRDVFDKSGLFDEYFYNRQDWDLWLRISRDFNIYQLKKPLVRYRLHSNNISKKIHDTIRFGEEVLLKNLKNAPADFDKSDILGNYYLDRCVDFYARYDMKSFRYYYKKGVGLAPERLTRRLRNKFYLSLIPIFLLKLGQSVKRKLKK